MSYANHSPMHRVWAVATAMGALLALPAVPAAAAEVPAPATTPVEVPKDYRLQPGDVIEVCFWNWSDEGDIRELSVGSGGSISYALGGIIPVAGLTLPQVTQRIEQALQKKGIRNPQITVTLKGRRQLPAVAYVLGAVKRAGPIELAMDLRAMDAIGVAGGLAPDADAARATLNRPGKGAMPVDVAKLLRGEPTENPLLNAGDTLIVPSRETNNLLTVLVVGQVMRPGTLQLGVGSRLSDAITAAGGPTPSAGLRLASLARAGVTASVDLEAILRRGDMAGNIPLLDRDVLLVPEAPRTEVSLLGEFVRPGKHAFREGDTIMDAVAYGGGPTVAADLKRAILKRDGKELPVDLEALIREGDMTQNRPLQDGDVLVVPGGTRIYAYGAVRAPGYLFIKQGSRLMDVLAQVGGPAPNANLAKAGVVRMVNGKPKVIPLNIKLAIEKGAAGRDFTFEKGDVLVVPEKNSFQWTSVLSTLYSLSLIGLNPLR